LYLISFMNFVGFDKYLIHHVARVCLNAVCKIKLIRCIHVVSYTGSWVCDTALIECTSSLGKTQGGSEFQREGYKGPMGDKGSQFTSNLGLRWTIPVTAGGSQVSKRGIQQRESSKGKCAMYS
jgi:hypothetical protein